MAHTSRFVLLPTRGFTADLPLTSSDTSDFLLSMASGGEWRATTAARSPRMTVLDSIHGNGAKLVALSDVALVRLKREQPGLRVVPEVFYPPAQAPRPRPLIGVQAFSARVDLARKRVRIVFQGSDKPVRDVDVIAFTDFAARRGASAKTNAKGEVRLDLPPETRRLERIYLYPAHGAWPMLLENWPLDDGLIQLAPIDPGFVDSRIKAYPKRAPGDGAGVTVGVIDTGVGPHAALRVAGGLNTVTGEDPADWSDSHDHGTHVAGILAGRGAGFRGVASGVSLRAYRVFGKNADGASSFAIAKAIDRAVADGCDLLNLSLGGGPDDPTTGEAIKAARAKGVVCVVAAGNDGGAVSWPGKHPLVMAVSALGYEGLWPAGSMQSACVQPPPGKNRCFIADFSNTGAEIDLTGPGVGVVSCIPHDRFGVMDGTSMACPAVTGAIARRLAADLTVLQMARDGERSDAIVKLGLTAARDMGLPPYLQGAGLA